MEQVIHFVYCLMFSNNKIYIGMSRTDKKGLFTLRYNNHANLARSGKKLPIYNAWRKHGAPMQTILSTHETRDECALAEIAAIAKLDATNPINGYNVCLGGQGNQSSSNPRIYAIMREKVWNNLEWRKKVSDSLKGRRPSEETQSAYKKWRSENVEYMRGKMRAAWQKDGYRENMSEKTRVQMANGGAQYLRIKFKDRGDKRTEEGKASQKQKVTIFMNTERGKEIARKGQAAMWSNPASRASMKAGTDKWRATDENKENCKRMSKLSALKCSIKVKLVETGEEFSSQHAMAIHFGKSDALISLWVKKGKVVRV